MISALRLRNFKCFEDRSLSLGKLTLLSGLNGMGKSSVLQALLLLRQSFQQGALPGKGLALNGEAVTLGVGQDVLYEDAQEEAIGFDLNFAPSETAQWQFSYQADADLLDLLQEECDYDSLLKISLFNDDFHYLQAERIGPRPWFAVSDYVVSRHRQLGTQGEYTAHFISVYGNDAIPVSELARSDGRSTDLRHQIEAWIRIVSPGVQIEISSHRGMDIVNLQYSYALEGRTSNTYRASNVGFGITYTLPVLTAILSSSPGSLLLLENPEAHLHPRGQVYIGQLMAMAAAHGIQILVETHSDHVLNGIRLAVHGGKTNPEDVRLYYFGRQDGQGAVSNDITETRIDKNGRIEHWPDGFFDEMDHSLATLLRPSEDRG
jgi:predicted ATPase